MTREHLDVWGGGNPLNVSSVKLVVAACTGKVGLIVCECRRYYNKTSCHHGQSSNICQTNCSILLVSTNLPQGGGQSFIYTVLHVCTMLRSEDDIRVCH